MRSPGSWLGISYLLYSTLQCSCFLKKKSYLPGWSQVTYIYIYAVLFLCDREAESGYHATVTHAHGPWACACACPCGSIGSCLMSDEAKFRYTGLDWLLLLLNQCTAEERDLGTWLNCCYGKLDQYTTISLTNLVQLAYQNDCKPSI